MANPASNLKLAPAETPEADAAETSQAPAPKRNWLRLVLLVVVPLIALAIGLTVYLMTGRYITTDNAYIGAQKVLITPDVSGKVVSVFVREGQRVVPGDKLMEIDPEPYQFALTQAKANLATVRVQYETLKANAKQFDTLVALRFLDRDGDGADARYRNTAETARFLDRLPFKLRGSVIWAVSSEDHYLRIHTDRGSDLILMRLSDALVELEGLEGAQTHRSWWVARDAVRDVSRGDGRATLTLEGGIEAPVSRRYAKALREAGWY